MEISASASATSASPRSSGSSGRRLGGLGGPGGHPVEEPEQLDRDRHDQRAVALARHLDHGLQQAQLQGRGVTGHDVGRGREALGGLVLTVGGDDAGSPLPLGLGLAGHGALHALRQGHVLDLDPLDPDAPGGLGRLVDDPAQLPVDRLTLGQQLIHLGLADDGPQRGLGLLGDGEHVVLHVHRGLDRVDHPEVDHRVDPDTHVVPGDAVLGGHGHGHDLHVDLLHAIADGADDVQSRAPHFRQHAPEAVDDAFFVLLDHADAPPGGGQAGDDQEHDDDDECCDHWDHLSLTHQTSDEYVRCHPGGVVNNHWAEIASQ